MFEKIQYDKKTNIIFGVYPRYFYTDIVNDIINKKEEHKFIDIAIYNISQEELNLLINICNFNRITLQLVTAMVSGKHLYKGTDKYIDKCCTVYIKEYNHCKMFLSNSYAYLGSFNFTFNKNTNIECGVEFTDPKIINNIKLQLFNILIEKAGDVTKNRVRNKLSYQKDAHIELFKDSFNWVNPLVLPSYMEDDSIDIATFNINLNKKNREPNSIYTLVEQLGMRDIPITITYTDDAWKSKADDYKDDDISQVVNLRKVNNNHSKVFLSRKFLHIGSSNFSLGSGYKFECGITISNQDLIKTFKQKFFQQYLYKMQSKWSSQTIITDSSIARDVIKTIDFFQSILKLAGYSYDSEEVTSKLKELLFSVQIECFENLIVDLGIFHKHGFDSSNIQFNIKSFIDTIKDNKEDENSCDISDNQINDFIEYLNELYTFLENAEDHIATNIRDKGVLHFSSMNGTI